VESEKREEECQRDVQGMEKRATRQQAQHHGRGGRERIAKKRSEGFADVFARVTEGKEKKTQSKAKKKRADVRRETGVTKQKR
jgi:hypothetical protein